MNNQLQFFRVSPSFVWALSLWTLGFYFMFAPVVVASDGKVIREASPLGLTNGYQCAGIIPQAFRMSKPWQLINPLAPSDYGYGRGLVSWRASEAKPKGFIAFSLKF